jgi:hypothetical protein
MLGENEFVGVENNDVVRFFKNSEVKLKKNTK